MPYTAAELGHSLSLSQETKTQKKKEFPGFVSVTIHFKLLEVYKFPWIDLKPEWVFIVHGKPFKAG